MKNESIYYDTDYDRPFSIFDAPIIETGLLLNEEDSSQKLKKLIYWDVYLKDLTNSIDKEKLSEDDLLNFNLVSLLIIKVCKEIEILERLHYQGLLDIDNSNNQHNSISYQLQTNLTDIQRGKLFDLLVGNGFIPEVNKEGFIWAFGGEQKPIDWQPIEWIDKSVKRKEPNIQTLFELIYLLGVDKDTSANNPKNLYRKMEYCFNGFVNIPAKNPSGIQQKTDRQKLLNTIIEKVRVQE